MEQVRVIFGPETLITRGIMEDRRGWAGGTGQRAEAALTETGEGRGMEAGAGDFW